MNLLVDTSVWSLVLRRKSVDESHLYVQAFRRHLEQNDSFFLIGPILQELLDGVRSEIDFKRLLHLLKPFPLLSLAPSLYIEASRLRNHCRNHGIQAGPIDFLIAAASIHWGYPLLTADNDFSRIARYSELRVVEV